MNKELKNTINALTDSYELEIRYLDEILQRVRELHKPRTQEDGMVYCEANCEQEYPCSTIRVLGEDNNKHDCDFILDLDGQITCSFCGCRDD